MALQFERSFSIWPLSGAFLSMDANGLIVSVKYGTNWPNRLQNEYWPFDPSKAIAKNGY
jgi:hypothetical protein